MNLPCPNDLKHGVMIIMNVYFLKLEYIMIQQCSQCDINVRISLPMRIL